MKTLLTGLLAAALLLPGGAGATDADREAMIHELCRNYAQLAGDLADARRQGLSAVDALGLLGEAREDVRREYVRIVVDVWSLPSASVPRQAVEDAELVHCLWQRLR